MEPRAATPPKRLETIRTLTGAGIPVACMAAPMIPGLNDHELETILEAGVNAGAKAGEYILLRLPLEIKDLFIEWLEAHVPNRKSKVLAMMRESRDGGLYVVDSGVSADYPPEGARRSRVPKSQRTLHNFTSRQMMTKGDFVRNHVHICTPR